MPGDRESVPNDPVLPLVYDELRRLAEERLRGERRDHTLQPTALAHEAWLRLSETMRGGGVDSDRFRIAAAGSIRRVLVDHARAKRAKKRGGAAERITVSGLAGREASPPLDLLVLDEALERLAEKDPRKARVVELRWFGGLSIEETARALGAATSTVEDDWAFARAWLRRRLEDAP